MMSTIRTLFPLLVSMGIALFLTLSVAEMSQTQHEHMKHAPWASFFSVFGMIYAIISGFLMVNVLGRHSDLSNAVEGELNAVEDLRDFLVYVDGQQEAKQHLKKELYDYICCISDREWGQMIKGAHINSDTTEEMYAVMHAVNEIKVNNESDRIALQSLIEKVSALTTLRTQRISLANQKLPPRLKLLLGFMSMVLVGSLIALGGKNLTVHVMMVSSITISVHLLYMIIADLNKPFEGVWQVSKEPLEEVKKEFAEEIKGKS